MILIDLFLSKKKYTAHLAKERLKILIEKNKRNRYEPYYFSQLKNDLSLVITKYSKVHPNKIFFDVCQNNNNICTIKINIPIE
ncbi:Cell division topological specificity factor [Buchnera aphidicola (Cinara cuneomaculata)]|uniref:Cell division topological specificity factor n=1 Tax=Buchnera aphidicola (Cinara cuneomaculata) TaxID=1660040 RepID=A0A451CXU5_9GAMM|nr:cell division topological specificity factor MinE [Buchnera aphidicola]VFP78203.1 Cell division topological specificity factor [Buchnera aphidicola (Cinara cuneomaculata)]